MSAAAAQLKEARQRDADDRVGGPRRPAGVALERDRLSARSRPINGGASARVRHGASGPSPVVNSRSRRRLPIVPTRPGRRRGGGRPSRRARTTSSRTRC